MDEDADPYGRGAGWIGCAQNGRFQGAKHIAALGRFYWARDIRKPGSPFLDALWGSTRVGLVCCVTLFGPNQASDPPAWRPAWVSGEVGRSVISGGGTA